MEPTDVYETYIRTRDGETYHPKTFRQGMEQFLSEEGYRITINIEGIRIVLRRNVRVDDDILLLDERLNQKSVDCMVTLGGLNE